MVESRLEVLERGTETHYLPQVYVNGEWRSLREYFHTGTVKISDSGLYLEDRDEAVSIIKKWMKKNGNRYATPNKRYERIT